MTRSRDSQAGPSPGEVLFDQWRLVRRLGRGGFGTVYEARDLHLGVTQAVKLLHPHLVAEAGFLERFRREVSTMRALVHPRVVRVYDYREDAGRGLALVSMAYVAGGAVWDLVNLARQRREPMPVALALRIAMQTLEALAAAHGEGVVHRDVTPRNVLLAGGPAAALAADAERDPDVRLVDFGLAGLLDRGAFSSTSTSLGTTGYVAPESFDPDAEVTAAADVYGVGAMTYELVTGQLPVGRFEHPSELRGSLPAGLDELLLDLLRRRPEARPGTVAALAALGGLERRLTAAPTTVEPSTTPAPKPVSSAPRRPVVRRRQQPVVRRRRRSRWPVGVAAVLLVGMVSLLGWYSTRGPEPVLEAGAGGDMVMIQLRGDTFTMGSAADDPLAYSDEKPAHRVIVGDFAIGKTEVTNRQYRQGVPKHPHDDDLPVANVSWREAKAFCEGAGDGYGLPTEAEWEYAARAGTQTPWSFGGDAGQLGEYAWYSSNSGSRAHEVGDKEANSWGLHDMHGNVWEWVLDCSASYAASDESVADPGLVVGSCHQDDTTGAFRVLRGGAFWDVPRFVRSAFRNGNWPEFRLRFIGFRCVSRPRRQLDPSSP